MTEQTKELLKHMIQNDGRCSDYPCRICPGIDIDGKCRWMRSDVALQGAKKALRQIRLEEIKKKYD